MGRDPAFLFYPNDYLGGTMGFSILDHGSYILTLIYQFNHGKFSENEIKNLIGDSWEKIRPKFKEENGLFFNQRLQNEIEKRKKHSEKQKENINKRWNKFGNTTVLPNQGITTVIPLENENEINNKINKKKYKLKKKKLIYSEEFLNFWNLTNKKGSKIIGYRAFQERLKINSLEEISKAYRQVNFEKGKEEFKFWPDISTFLNSGFEGYLERSNQPKKERLSLHDD